MSKEYRNRVVILCGPRLTHKNTCATLINHDLNVVGICEADQRKYRLPLSYILKSVRKKGFFHTVSTIFARLFYSSLNQKKDLKIYHELFGEDRIARVLESWDGSIHKTADYSDPETIAWLRNLEPDVFVVHTPYWVAKKVREIPRKKVVIGGHPGKTPYYRGSHSSFWAILNGQPEMVGCTVFWVNSGVDTGDIVAQEIITINDGDSFVTLGWKGMKRIAEIQSAVLVNYDAGVEIPRLPIDKIPPNSEFGQPDLAQYLKYKSKQSMVR